MSEQSSLVINSLMVVTVPSKYFPSPAEFIGTILYVYSVSASNLLSSLSPSIHTKLNSFSLSPTLISLINLKLP